MTTNIKIHWINTGSDSGERGYWESVEGRFNISPNYRHTVNPSHYTVQEKIAKGQSVEYNERSFDTVTECKVWALGQLQKYWKLNR